jgi:DNA-binding GntR family transcriptional regulator
VLTRRLRYVGCMIGNNELTDSSGPEDGATGLSAARIRELILQRIIVPGEQVRQEDIAGQIGMSRGPIREALHMLAAEGTLKYVRNRGYFVAQFTASEMRQLYRIRDLLESEVLSGLPSPSAEHLAELRDLNAQIRDKNVTLDEVIALNSRFHNLMMERSDLNLILTEVGQVSRKALAYQAMAINLPAGWSQVADDHDLMIQALEAQDSDSLLAHARVHRERSLSRLIPLLR